MELIGRSTINPLLFYTGKISGYITWIVMVSLFCNINFIGRIDLYYNTIIAYCLLATGLAFTIISLLHLGKSTRLGLPTDSTKLKTNGIYKISRNPMYVGFGFFTLASMIYTFNVFIIISGVYSLVVYHLIIKSEEKFLLIRFGGDYEIYKKNVRRYL